MTRFCCQLPYRSDLNHCAQCHETFATLILFDRHHQIRRGAVLCKHPRALGLVKDTWGTWRTAQDLRALTGRLEKMREARA